MPHAGAVTLADVRAATLSIGCGRCGRCGRYDVKQLIAVYGADAKLPDLLVTLADCPKARSVGVHDRCKAVYDGLEEVLNLSGRKPRVIPKGAIYIGGWVKRGGSTAGEQMGEPV